MCLWLGKSGQWAHTHTGNIWASGQSTRHTPNRFHRTDRKMSSSARFTASAHQTLKWQADTADTAQCFSPPPQPAQLIDPQVHNSRCYTATTSTEIVTQSTFESAGDCVIINS